MYAIISDGCQQYRVEEGQELDIDFRESLSEGEELVIEDVLAVSDQRDHGGDPRIVEARPGVGVGLDDL